MGKEKFISMIDKIIKFIFYFGTITLPSFILCYIISLHSNVLISERLEYYLPKICFVLFILWIFSYLYVVNRQNQNIKKVCFVTGLVFVSMFTLLKTLDLIYSEDSKFQKLLMNANADTMNHKQATWFYTKLEIGLEDEPEEMTKDSIEFDTEELTKPLYANKFEEHVLTKDPGNDIYKIIKLKGKTINENHKYEGYLAVIYDPSKVKVAVSSGAGTGSNSYGETLETIARRENALVAINAGGFYDPFWNSNGGIPHGLVITSGKVTPDPPFRRIEYAGGVIGFNKKNKLVLKYMSRDEAVAEGIRDAVDFGPFLIVNGVNQYKNRKGYWGFQPRTAIGQRKDGIVLMLVIDGRLPHTDGVDMEDLAKIMEDYGAINAANLDGGTSSTMIVKNKIINQPTNGWDPITIRRLPNAFIVTK